MAEELIALYKSEIAVYICFLLILLVTGGAANILVAYVIQKKSRQQNIHNRLIQHLCLSNLITCLFPTIATLTTLSLQLNEQSEAGLCYLRHVTIFISFFANFLILTALSIEKYDIIVNPFKKTLTESRLYKLIIGIWLSTLLAAVGISIEYWKVEPKKCFNKVKGGSTTIYYVLTMGAFFIMFLVSLYCYIKILLAIRRHVEAMKGKTTQRRNLDKQPAKMVAIFILTFVVLWLPTGIVRIIRSRGVKSTAIDHIYIFTGIMMYFSALCHPLTCITLSTAVRGEIKLLLRLKKDQTEKSENSSNGVRLSGISVITDSGTKD